MEGNTILSDLCSICHIQAPKYKCPRCLTRTCSLNCAQRHKRRAPCSGERDPAAFVKRSQLATPATFDQDFNFLAGLERRMVRDGEGLEDKFPAREGGQVSRSRKRELFIRKAWEMGVFLRRAPRGMMRERENLSRIAQKSHEMIWTIEWFDENHTRCLTTTVGQTAVDVAFRTAACLLKIPGFEYVPRHHPRKRKRKELEKDRTHLEHEESKPEYEEIKPEDEQIKPEDEEIKPEHKAQPEKEEVKLEHVTNDTNLDPGVNETAGLEDTTQQNSQKSRLEDKAQQEVEMTENDSSAAQKQMATSDSVEQCPDSAEEPNISYLENTQIKETTAPKPQTPEPQLQDILPKPESPIPYFFYLIKPRTTLSKKVLTPIDASLPINDILRGKEILEFPSIQILTEPPDQLPEGFMTAEQYRLEFSRQQQELQTLVSSSEVLSEDGTSEVAATSRIPNGQDILAILQRDIQGNS